MLQTILPRLAASAMQPAPATAANGLGHIKHMLDQRRDVSIANWADSLSNSRENPREFIFRLADVIATHPSRPTVLVETWADGSYGGATTEAAGSGPVVRIRNFAMPGALLAHGLGALWRDSGLADTTPDLLTICHGHNHVVGTTIEQITGEFYSALEYFRLAHPGVPVVALLQNPRADSPAMDRAVDAWQQVARLRDVALIDAHTPYIAEAKQPAWFADGDQAHPSDAGIEGAYVPAIRAAWDAAPARPVCGQPSTLRGLDPALNLIPNGDFAQFDGAVPEGWVATAGVTATRETAIVRDRALGHSLKLTSVGGTAFANRISHTLPNYGHAPLRGKPISLFGWVCKPAGAPPSLGAITLEALAPAGKSTTCTTRPLSQDQGNAWVPWAICGLMVPAECYEITVRLHHDTAAATASQPAFFQGITLVPGYLPRGL
jgi:hypothetical protein|tara:strand:- start:6271 stop:7575 length:1305 start_codon:yes stop_codon:yes gene_type:complete